MNLFWEIFLLNCFIKFYECVSPSDNYDDYYILKNITTGYQKTIRPSSTLYITIKLSLKAVSAIDEKNLIMTSDSYFTGTFDCNIHNYAWNIYSFFSLEIKGQWYDSRLQWTPSDYGDNKYVWLVSSQDFLFKIIFLNNFLKIKLDTHTIYIAMGAWLLCAK